VKTVKKVKQKSHISLSLLLWKIHKNIIFKFYIKYKFQNTFYSETEKIEVEYQTEVDIWKKKSFKDDLVRPQYQTFPLDEICFPFISNALIDHEQYKCVYFLRTI